MAENKFFFWNKTGLDRQYLSAVSLHSHTNYSKESLRFIPEFTWKHPILHWALERQALKSTIPVDLVKAYWTPPLHPKAAFEVERNQIEAVLSLMGLVSLTDHDTIEAPALLRTVAETKEVPLSLEWSVPFGKGAELANLSCKGSRSLTKCFLMNEGHSVRHPIND